MPFSYSRKHNLFLLTICAVPAIFALIFIITYGYNIPLWDSWEVVPVLEKVYTHQPISLSYLAAQHVEHRLLFPRVIFISLALLSNWNALYEIYFSFFLSCITFYVLYARIKSVYTDETLFSTKKNYTAFGIACLLVSTFIFCITQQENMLWGFQIQIYLNVLMVFLGINFLTNKPDLSISSIVFSVLCGIVATYSFASGLLFWPIAGLIILIRSRPGFRIMFASMWVVITLLVVGMYFHNYKSPKTDGNTAWIFVVKHPAQYALYILKYIGSPLVKYRVELYFPVAIMGLLGLSGVALLSYYLIKAKTIFNRNIVFWHGVLLYGLLSAAIAGLGRAGFGTNQALISRYITFGNLAWLWLIVVGIYVYSRLTNYNYKYLVPACMTLLLLFAYYSKCVFSDSQILYQKKIAIEHALRSDSTSSAVLSGYIYVKPKVIDARNSFLRKERLTFYKEDSK